jgi:hypothetical protein
MERGCGGAAVKSVKLSRTRISSNDGSEEVKSEVIEIKLAGKDGSLTALEKVLGMYKSYE